MKKLTFALLLMPIFAMSQKLAEDKVDEFTKLSVKRTSWEPFSRANGFWCYVRTGKIEGNYLLYLRFLTGSILSVQKDAAIMLKAGKDSIISLSNLDYSVSCTGCGAIGLNGSGAPGIELKCHIPSDVYSYLIDNKVTKVRIYTSSGYVEHDIKEKFADVLVDELKLVK